jgi:hypothetical protein
MAVLGASCAQRRVFVAGCCSTPCAPEAAQRNDFHPDRNAVPARGTAVGSLAPFADPIPRLTTRLA